MQVYNTHRKEKDDYSETSASATDAYSESINCCLGSSAINLSYTVKELSRMQHE